MLCLCMARTTAAIPTCNSEKEVSPEFNTPEHLGTTPTVLNREIARVTAWFVTNSSEEQRETLLARYDRFYGALPKEGFPKDS